MPGHDVRAGAPTSHSDPGRYHFALSVTGGDLPTRPYAVYCEAPGTITLVDEAGTALPYTMVAGQKIDFSFVRVSAISAGTFYGQA